jgi:ABC-type multidrug transport system ATPase subunit
MNILQWKNLSITTKDKKKLILDNISGEVTSGQTLAIMGSSGAGKTTFLNYLSTRTGTSGLHKESGDIKFIVNELDESRSLAKLSAFVTQDDILYEVLTVEELLNFAALIKLVSKTDKERKAIVDNLITRLGLEKCRGTKVGSVLSKGLSGGEKKRTAIGYELITNPYVLFLDEPTTGLDTKSAYNVIKLITEDAKANNRLVIYTIHQPSSDLFTLFENLLLLAQGKTVYFGKASESIRFFTRQGYPCPRNFNPAEYFLKILSRDHKEKEIGVVFLNNENSKIIESENSKIIEKENSKILEPDSSKSEDLISKPSEKEAIDDYNTRIENFEDAAELVTILTDLSKYEKSRSVIKVESHNLFKQFAILFARNFKIVARDKLTYAFRVFFTIIQCVLALLVYNNLGTGDNAVLDRKGCLFFITNLVIQASLQNTLVTFTQEKPKFYKEQESEMYSIIPYFFSKTILEIPLQILAAIVNFFLLYFILGLNDHGMDKYFIYILIIFGAGYAGSSMGIFMSAIIDNPQIIPAVFPLLLYTQIISSGYFVSQSNIPYVFYPFKYISLFRYTYQALSWNEFTDIGDLNCHNPVKCQLPLDDFSEGLFMSIVCLGIILVFNTFISIVSLKVKVWLRK